MDQDGKLLDRGEIGEIVIRGDNVTAGYANLRSQRGSLHQRLVPHRRPGRARRGGLLGLTGRLKELINRGGEKIAPREVDDALLAHPAVAQAVAFAAARSSARRCGRGRAARRPGAERQVLRASPPRASPLQGAAKIVFVPEIPKGATGKLQRVGLAQPGCA